MKNYTKILFAIVFLGFTYVGCQKADPAPYGDPNPAVPRTTSTYTNTTHDTTHTPPDTTPSFTAYMNGGSSVTSFTPSKSISGSNTILKGVSTYYTITITFPTSTGPGNYNIGFGGPMKAAIINGGTTYVINNDYGGGGIIIDSISSKGKYYGTFHLSGLDSVTFNSMSANEGIFYHL